MMMFSSLSIFVYAEEETDTEESDISKTTEVQEEHIDETESHSSDNEIIQDDINNNSSEDVKRKVIGACQKK